MNTKIPFPAPCNSCKLTKSRRLDGATRNSNKFNPILELTTLDSEEDYESFKENLTSSKQKEEIHNEIFSILKNKKKCKNLIIEKLSQMCPPRVSNFPVLRVKAKIN